MLTDQFPVTFLPELLRIGRLAANQPQTRDSPTLLVNRDNRLNIRKIPQIINQLPHLPS